MIPDFSDVKCEKDITDKFIKAGRSILLETDLICRNERFQITALELYLFHKKLWKDKSTDRDPEGMQLEAGKWYIRRRGHRTRWRIDITAGNKDNSIYAGLLIAAIGNENGPGIALNKILHGNTDPKINKSKRIWDYSRDGDTIETIHGSIATSQDSYLRLEKCKIRSDHSLFIGLRKNPPTHEKRFQEARLRISIDPPCGRWKENRDLQMERL